MSEQDNEMVNAALSRLRMMETIECLQKDRDEATRRANSLEKKLVASINETIALRTLVRAMQALYNQDVGDIVTEQGDRFATVYDMCRAALNHRAQQLLEEQKGVSHGQ